MKGSRFRSRDESTGLLFWQVSTLWQRAVKAALRQFGLTHTQYVMLAVIAELEEGGSITQKQVSDFSMVDSMTVSATLRLLEKKGLVQRVPSKRDSRAHEIRNTEKGQAMLRAALEAVENVDFAFFFEEEGRLGAFREHLTALKQKNQGGR